MDIFKSDILSGDWVRQNLKVILDMRTLSYFIWIYIRILDVFIFNFSLEKRVCPS